MLTVAPSQHSGSGKFISDCYMQVLACIATQYMPIRVRRCTMYWHVLWYVLVVCIEYMPACIQC